MIATEIWADASSAIHMAELVRLKLAPGPLAGFLQGVVEPHLKDETDATFGKEASPAGDPWAPLAPSTIQNRLDEGYLSGPIQYRSGELFNFFQDAGSDILATPAGTQMDWPSKSGIDAGSGRLKYKVGSAQRGNKRTGAPPRPIMGLTIHDLEFVTMGLLEYIVGVRL